MAYLYDDDEKWEKKGSGSGWSYRSGYGYSTTRAANARKALQPLLDHIRQYDALRQKLEMQGGAISDVAKVTELLSLPITLKGDYRDCKASLIDQASLRTAIFDVGRSDLHIDVRQLPTGMPVYYLCRIRRDYWSEYTLIVEDLYQSAGYPVLDERFVRLMDGGHETYYLRLSQFREGVKTALPDKSSRSDTSEWDTDDILYHTGRHVFQAAWHEDQRPGVLTATHFGLVNFRQAIELLYLCLSGELCELRNATNKRLLSFFEQTYPQPAIRAFLGVLSGLDGAAINDLPQKALKLYARLSNAFSRFLSVEVPWGHRQVTTPLYKLVFGNFSRLALVADRLGEEACIRNAAQRLEEASQAIVGEIVE